MQVVAASLLLFHPEGMDPSLVDSPPLNSGPNAPPSPFQRLDPHGPAFRAFLPLYAIGLAIAGLGAAAALLRHPLALKLYSLAAFFHLLCAAPFAPSALLPPALATAVVPIALAHRLYTRLVPSCAIVPSNCARRFS